MAVPSVALRVAGLVFNTLQAEDRMASAHARAALISRTFKGEVCRVPILVDTEVML